MMIRILDIILSFFGIIILSPLFIIFAIAIKFESRGSVFFLQQRVGINNSNFMLIKLRSMYTDSSCKGLLTVGNNDTRITKVGYFIRKYKIDEIPQLINVLIGTMSMVGPRPEVRKYVDKYSSEQKIVLSVKPGITDYASIEFLNENEILGQSKTPEQDYISIILPKKIELNMRYIQDTTLKSYLEILFKTAIKIFSS